MLYILPPLRSQNPPAPWTNLVCGGGTTTATNNNNNNSNGHGTTDNVDNMAWKNEGARSPKKIRLRDLQILPKKVDVSVVRWMDGT